LFHQPACAARDLIQTPQTSQQPQRPAAQ
jgi:hypothetical protein